MRRIPCWFIAAVIALAAACGPSAAMVKRARTARYTCDRKIVLKAVYLEIEAQQPPIARVDVENGIVVSKLRWHGEHGHRKIMSNSIAQGGDIMFGVVAAMVSRPDGWLVIVQPRILVQIAWSPRGKEILRTDPAWPTWADDKADALLVGIHNRLDGCVIP